MIGVSIALIGSVLTVALVACWYRLQREQAAARRQLAQPDATEASYHGLQESPQPRQDMPPAYSVSTPEEPSNSARQNNGHIYLPAASRQLRTLTYLQGCANVHYAPYDTVPGPPEPPRRKTTVRYIVSGLQQGQTADEMPADGDYLLLTDEEDDVRIIS